MQLISNKLSIDFMGKRHLAAILSLVLVIVSVGSLMSRGLNFGIDFTGGTLIEAGYGEAVELESVRNALAADNLPPAQVQHFGTASEVLIRIAPVPGKASAQLSEDVMVALANQNSSVEKRRVEFVGPQVGEELTEQGGLAMIYALIGILIYIIVRFQWRFAPGAVLALVHDVLITMGLFSILQLNFDLTVLAALLAVIGYSLNDTIVVFDRIRENFRKMRKGSPFEIINRSINQTLARTLMTSVTTLLVLVSLFLFGGEVIRAFSIALITGVLVGTYSSIFVASSTALALGISKADLVQSAVRPENQEQQP